MARSLSIRWLGAVALGVLAAAAGDRAAEAAEDGVPEYSLFRGDYWLEYIDDAAKILASPVRWDQDDWLNAAGVAAVTGAVYLIDEPFKDFWQDDIRSNGTDEAASIFQSFGDTKWILPALPTLFAAGGLVRYGFKDVEEGGRLQETALLAAEAFILSAGITEGIKRLAGRERPNNTDDHDVFEGFGGSKSFPSGHSTHAWALAAVVASEYRHSPAIRIGAYTLAALTSLARINDNKHWASDVVFGGAIGYFVGKFVYDENPFRNSDNMLFGPMAVANGTGVQMTYKF
jgi:membrane-associated phospholipid phosphatase